MSTILDLLFPPACGGCERPDSGWCDRCAATLGSPDRFSIGGLQVTAAGRYERPLRKAILLMKRGRRDVTAGLGRQLAVTLASAGLGAARLVWAPTTKRRRLERGFDQARLLANSVASETGGAACEGLRRRAGPAQQGKDRAGRLASGGRFTANRPAVAGAGPVLLVDDVVTTGATLIDARAALQEAGVAVAGALVLARTVQRDEAFACRPAS